MFQDIQWNRDSIFHRMFLSNAEILVKTPLNSSTIWITPTSFEDSEGYDITMQSSPSFQTVLIMPGFFSNEGHEWMQNSANSFKN